MTCGGGFGVRGRSCLGTGHGCFLSISMKIQQNQSLKFPNRRVGLDEKEGKKREGEKEREQ